MISLHSRTASLLTMALASCAWAADPPVPAVEAPGVRVLPKMVIMSSTRRFDDAGAPQGSTNEVRVELKLATQGDRQLQSCRGVQLATATTTSGAVLKTRDERNGAETFSKWEREQGNYDITLVFSVPGEMPTGIASLAGTVTLAVIAGEASQSDVAPLSSYIGKPLLLAGLDQPLTFTVKDGRVTMRGSREAIERIEEVAGLRADGRVLQAGGYSGGSDGDEHYRTFNFTLPDNGGLRITLLPSSRDLIVPFTVGPLPLTGERPVSGAEPIRIPANQPKPPAPVNKPRIAPEAPPAESGF
ncbi:MAG TPA: hypothetical protein DCS97_13195 [Planctomycetes bacterium]|nr:hypothetical protein [Planctomycetota bacterium]